MNFSLPLLPWMWLDIVGTIFGNGVALSAITAAASTSLFMRRRGTGDRARKDTTNLPMVSILKPLKGVDYQLAENLAAFVNLKGQPYEVLIGIADKNDPAVAVVEQFITENPNAPFKLIITSDRPSCNPKVINLIGLETHAKGEIIIISDGNTRPHQNSLLRLVAVFDDPRVGWACTPFFVRKPSTLGAQLRAVHIGTELLSILCGVYYLTGIPLMMGKWMAVRKQALLDMGGFATLESYLGEDGAIGPILTKLNWKGAIAPDIIDIYFGDWRIQQAWAQLLRWGRLIRSFNPAGPFNLLLWNGTFWLFLAAIFWLAKARLGAAFLAFAGIASWLCNSFTYVRFGGDARHLITLPLADIKAILIVVFSYISSDVIWRGQRFRLGKNSQILSSEPITFKDGSTKSNDDLATNSR